HTQEGTAGQARGRVAQAVPEVEPGAMAAPPEASIGFDRLAPVRLPERDGSDPGFLEEPQQQGPGITAEPGRQNDPGLGERGRAHAGNRGLRELGQHGLMAGLTDEDGDDRRGIDDHTPFRPYPRIASSSFRDSRRPRTALGNVGHTSSSRKRRSSAPFSRRWTWNASRSLRSSRALRIARVLLTPVMEATSLASRSVSGTLMFRAMPSLRGEILHHGVGIPPSAAGTSPKALAAPGVRPSSRQGEPREAINQSSEVLSEV